MKKILLFIISVVCIATYFVRVNVNASSYPLSNSGLGMNILDPQYFAKDSSGNLTYEAWIPFDEQMDYKFYFRGFSSTKLSDTITLEFKETGNSIDVTRDTELELLFSLDFNSNFQEDDESTYFRLVSTSVDALNNASIDDIKANACIFDASGDYYYMPYFYDESYVSYTSSATVVTTTDHLIDVESFIDEVYVQTDRGSCTTTISSDGYTDNYQTPGTYKVIYNTMKTSFSRDFLLYIVVFSADQPVISGSDSLTYYVSGDFSGYISSSDFFDTLYTFTYGTREVSMEYIVTDSDGNEVTFESICSVAGEYTLTINGIYKSEIVATKTVSLIIDDDTCPEIFYPNYIISLSDTTEATNEELCDYLEAMLASSNIYVDNISVISSTYKGNGNIEGNYEIIYQYSVDGATYIAKANINVSADCDDSNFVDTITTPSIDSTTSINVYMYVCFGLILLILLYISIKIVKTRKKRD